MDNYALKITMLNAKRKKFNLKNINMMLEPGFIYAIAGENGAGKTTLFKYILSEGIKYSGDIVVFGENIRKNHKVFDADATAWTVDTWDDSILGLIKAKEEEKLVALFNFSQYDKVAWINEEDGMYVDLLSGREMEARGVQIPAYGCYWLMKKG